MHVSACPRSRRPARWSWHDVDACSITLNSHRRSSRGASSGRRSQKRRVLAATSCTWRSQLSTSPSARPERGAHAAAAVVSDDDDVLDLEHVDGELHHRQAIEVGMHDDVGDVAVDEHLARRQADDLVGRHAAVGAADPEVFRRLLPASRPKNSGWRMRSDQARLRSSRCLREGMASHQGGGWCLNCNDTVGLKKRDGVSSHTSYALRRHRTAC